MLIREYKQGDEAAITELVSIVTPRHPFTLEYLKWSNLQNPDGESLSLVAKEGNEIIAHYAILPYKVGINNNIIMGGLALQAVVHPYFQKLKLFLDLTNKLWEKATDRFQFTYGFPSNDRILITYESLMGWKKIDKFYADVINVPTVVKILKSNPCQNLEVKKIDKFPLEIDGWLNGKKSGIYPIKSAKLLNWRFPRHPVYHYYIFGVYDKEMVGYIVLKIYWNGKKAIGHFVDFDVEDNKEEYLLALIRESSLFFTRCKIDDIVFWNRQLEYSDMFDQLDIKKGGFKINFAIKFFNDKMDKRLFLDKSKWNFTMAVADAF